MIARICVVLVVLVLAGCTSPPDEPGGKSSPAAPTPEVGDRRPEDRDREAVLAALRGLDLCAVVDVPNARPRASEPMSCEAGPIRVTVVPLSHAERVSMTAQAVGGAKAYVDDQGGRCVVHLPVSFELAVAFSGSGACQAVIEVAAGAAAVLADQASARVEPRWDPCTVLDEVLEPEPDRLFVGTELGVCQYVGVPREQEAMLSFGEPEPSGQPRGATIAGTDVQIYEDDDNCGIRWRQRPFDSRFAAAPDYPVVVFSVGCEYSTELAENVIGVLARPAPRGAPQHPLLYGPGEPDGPYLGDCAYLEDENDARRCEPAGDVPVPDDLTGTGDARVMCAASADAVREHFGGRLRPVAVVGEGCHFVEAEREIVVTFAVRSGTPGGGGGREVTIAGRHGFVEARAGGFDYTVAVDGGVVELTVEVGPVGTDLPPGSDTMAEAVIADLAAA